MSCWWPCCGASSTPVFNLWRFDASTYLWQQLVGNGASPVTEIQVDSSDTIYALAGNTLGIYDGDGVELSSQTVYGSYIAVTDNFLYVLSQTGVVTQYDKSTPANQLATYNTNVAVALSLAADTSDNFYVCGLAFGIVSDDIEKYNSAGVKQWGNDETFSFGGGFLDVSVDTSGNVAVGGFNHGTHWDYLNASTGADIYGYLSTTARYYRTYSTDDYAYIAFGNSPTAVVQYTLSTGVYSADIASYTDQFVNDLQLDSSGNVYVATNVTGDPANNKVFKYDDAGSELIAHAEPRTFYRAIAPYTDGFIAGGVAV